jgi:hypothetical protein
VPSTSFGAVRVRLCPNARQTCVNIEQQTLDSMPPNTRVEPYHCGMSVHIEVPVFARIEPKKVGIGFYSKRYYEIAMLFSGVGLDQGQEAIGRCHFDVWNLSPLWTT